MLIEAYAHLCKETPCWLLMAGDGPLRQQMEDLIRHLQIRTVLLPGFLNQADLSRAYIAADIFVLPVGIYGNVGSWW